MTRNDSALYTGATSRSFAAPKEQTQRTKARELKAEKRLKLSPVGEILRDEFQKEINLLIYAPYPDEDKMTDAQFRAERLARRLSVASLMAIRNRLNIILKEPEAELEESNG